MSNTYNYGVQKGTGSFNVLQYTENSSGTTKTWMTSGSKGPSLSNLTDVTILGNLSVQGTTTTVDSTTVSIGDRIIELNTQPGSGDAGIYVQDADNDATGSLLYDTATSRWMGGVKDSEVDLVDISSPQTLTFKTMTSADLNTPDIDGGTIDGATLGGNSQVTITSADMNGGSIDGTTIGASSQSSVRATTLSGSSTLDVDGDAQFNSSVVVKSGQTLRADTVDINGGYIDGAVIGANSTAAGSFTTLAATGDVDLGSNWSDSISFGGDVDTDIKPTNTDSNALGSNAQIWQKLYVSEIEGSSSADNVKITSILSASQASRFVGAASFDSTISGSGAATLASLRCDSVNLDGGTIDGTAIGGNSRSTGAFTTLTGSGAATLASLRCDSVNLDGGAIDGTVIGANSAAAGTFAAVVATTVGATSVSASSFVSGSSFEVDGQASISYDSSALDFSNGSAGAALSATHFSSSVELQGPSLEVSGAAQVGSLTINGTALTATAAEINDLASNDVDGSDFTKLSSITATAAELNYLDNADLTAADLTKLAAITATAAEINDLASNDVDGSDFTKLSEVTATSAELNYVDVTAAGAAEASKAVVLDGSKNITAIGTVGCGAITSTGASSFGATTLSSLNNSSGGITNAGSIAGVTDVDGSGDLAMGTITMAGFSVDADGDTSVKSLVSTAGIEGTTISGSGDFTSAGAGTFATGLTVTSGGGTITAGGLTVSAGTTAVQALTATTATFSSTLTANGNVDLGSDTSDSVTFNGLLDSDIVPDATGNSRKLGSSTSKFSAVYATNVYTGDMHLKNERGDWTIFEESDHLRIRNNATGQTFKMAMTPIEE